MANKDPVPNQKEKQMAQALLKTLKMHCKPMTCDDLTSCVIKCPNMTCGDFKNKSIKESDIIEKCPGLEVTQQKLFCITRLECPGFKCTKVECNLKQ